MSDRGASPVLSHRSPGFPAPAPFRCSRRTTYRPALRRITQRAMLKVRPQRMPSLSRVRPREGWALRLRRLRGRAKLAPTALLRAAVRVSRSSIPNPRRDVRDRSRTLWRPCSSRLIDTAPTGCQNVKSLQCLWKMDACGSEPFHTVRPHWTDRRSSAARAPSNQSRNMLRLAARSGRTRRRPLGRNDTGAIPESPRVPPPRQARIRIVST